MSHRVVWSVAAVALAVSVVAAPPPPPGSSASVETKEDLVAAQQSVAGMWSNYELVANGAVAFVVRPPAKRIWVTGMKVPGQKNTVAVGFKLPAIQVRKAVHGATFHATFAIESYHGKVEWYVMLQEIFGGAGGSRLVGEYTTGSSNPAPSVDASSLPYDLEPGKKYAPILLIGLEPDVQPEVGEFAVASITSTRWVF